MAIDTLTTDDYEAGVPRPSKNQGFDPDLIIQLAISVVCANRKERCNQRLAWDTQRPS